MYQVVEEVYRSHGLEIDLDRSVFVGDAAGRLGNQGRKKDHGDTDYKLALNVGLKFLTPEVSDPLICHADDRNTSSHIQNQLTLSHPPGFVHPKSEILLLVSQKVLISLTTREVPHVVPSNTPLARDEVEIVLFVGSP